MQGNWGSDVGTRPDDLFALHNQNAERPFAAHRSSFAVRVRSSEFCILYSRSCVLTSLLSDHSRVDC